MADIVTLSLGIDATTEVVVERGMMARLRTGKIGCSSPELTEGNIAGTILIGDTDAEEALTSLAEQGRLRRCDHTLLSKSGLPLLLTSEVIEESGSQLTEIAATHLHTADVLQVVELLVFLLLGKAEGLNGLGGIILLERIVVLQSKGFGKHGTIGSISPGCHRGTTSLKHHGPIRRGVSDTLRIGLTITDGEEEVNFIACLVYQIGNAIATLADAKIVVRQATIGKDIGQQHIINIADMGQMAVPVESIGMTAFH